VKDINNETLSKFWQKFTVANWIQIVLILVAIFGQMVRDIYRYDARISAQQFQIDATAAALVEMGKIIQRADVLRPELQEINRRLSRLEGAAGLRPLENR